MGGNVNQLEPVLDAKYFRKSPLNPKHVIGFHVLGKWVTGYGGKVAPPFNRFYMGGENDIRGFDIWGISPIACVPTSSVQVLNNDGTPRMQSGSTPTETGPLSEFTRPSRRISWCSPAAIPWVSATSSTAFRSSAR